MTRGIGDWEQRLQTALVKSSPTDLVRVPRDEPGDAPADPPPRRGAMPCETCHDSQWVIERIDGVERARRCDCWRATLAEQQLAQARIPRGYLHCELGNFEQSTDSLRDAHRRARAFIEAFPVPDKGLLLHGRHGVGKTHLAVAILKDVIRVKGGRGFFYETRDLLKLVRDTYAGGDATEMEVLRPVLDADLPRSGCRRRWGWSSTRATANAGRRSSPPTWSTARIRKTSTR
jgi:IstB-like ATP binding protein